MDKFPLLKNNYSSIHTPFLIKIPPLRSGARYYFYNEKGLNYQVSFGKKKSNYLDHVINFSVISDDYEDEYATTNQGNIWKVISTIVEIIKIYHDNHPNSRSYEFSGEFKDNESEKESSIRTRLFLRTLQKVVDFNYWKVHLQHNKVLLTRIYDE